MLQVRALPGSPSLPAAENFAEAYSSLINAAMADGVYHTVMKLVAIRRYSICRKTFEFADKGRLQET